MSAFWFSLWVNTAYFLADVFIKLGSKELTAGKLIYIRSIFTVLLASIWLLASGDVLQGPSLFTILQLIGCSILCAFGLYFYIEALRNLHFVNVSVIGICGALIHYVIGLLQGEHFNAWFLLAAALAIFGIAIQWRKTQHPKGMVEAVLSAVLWGFGYALMSFPLANTSAIWGTWISEITLLLLSFVFLFRSEPNYTFLRPEWKNYQLILVALFTISGSVLMNICYQEFSLNLMGFMQLSFFPYSLLAGYFIFKEKLSINEWIGNSLVVAGLGIYFYICN
jgi:drug/metabolite transporter (DMT)-like permease